MLEYISKFFTEGDVGSIIAKVILILAVSLIYFTVFYYTKKRNLDLFTVIIAVSLTVLFALSFFTEGLTFFALFLFATYLIAAFVFFGADFRRDIFRFTLKRWYDKDSLTHNIAAEELHKSVREIIKACQRLSKTDTGALIIISDNMLDSILDSGTKINAEITAELLETLFFPRTPLHDGAVVITANKVVSAGCYLPLTQDTNLPREFGTRHRAAIGVSEVYPSLTVLVVSEETGIISAMHDGKVKRYLDVEQMKAILECAMRLSDAGAEERIWGLAKNNEEE